MLEYLTNFDKVRVFKENKYLFIPYYVVECNKNIHTTTVLNTH